MTIAVGIVIDVITNMTITAMLTAVNRVALAYATIL